MIQGKNPNLPCCALHSRPRRLVAAADSQNFTVHEFKARGPTFLSLPIPSSSRRLDAFAQIEPLGIGLREVFVSCLASVITDKYCKDCEGR